jgi:putative nucleotidyltransferase with HDIG domain
MMVTQKQVYRSERRNLNRLMDRLWRHALAAALAFRYLANSLDNTSEVGFLAGLIHDIGKLLLVKIIEDLQKSESLPGDISDDLIIDILEDMHCIQGERLIRQLNLPDIYCRVVAEHHGNNASEKEVILDLVRLSNLACRKLGIGIRSDPSLMLPTTPEATRLLANDLLLAELQVKMEEQIDSVEKLLRAD